MSAKLPAGASVYSLHDEVGTAADWEMARWAAFPQLDTLFGSATSTSSSRSRTVCRHACRCSRNLLYNASSWAHPVPLRPHHCVYVGRHLSCGFVSSGPEVIAAAATREFAPVVLLDTLQRADGKCLMPFERKYNIAVCGIVEAVVRELLRATPDDRLTVIMKPSARLENNIKKLCLMIMPPKNCFAARLCHCLKGMVPQGTGY